MSSIILNTEQILNQIKKSGYKTAKIYEGFLTNVSEDSSRVHFDKFNCDTTEELLAEMETFASSFQGKFSVLFRTRIGGTDKSVCFVRWSTVTELATNNNVVHNSPQFDIDNLKKSWLAEMHTMFRIKELESQLALKDAELKGMQSQGDKLAYVGQQILQGWLVKNKLNPSLQGFAEEKPNTPVQTTQEAFNKLLALLGEETINKLAGKLQPEGMEINLIKEFANS